MSATTIDNVRDAPSIVKEFSADLQAVEPILQNLHKALRGERFFSNYFERSDKVCGRKL